jgi:hypothetical protein
MQIGQTIFAADVERAEQRWEMDEKITHETHAGMHLNFNNKMNISTEII